MCCMKYLFLSLFLPGLCSHKVLCSPVMSRLFHLLKGLHRLRLFSLQGEKKKDEIPTTETKSSVTYKCVGSHARVHKYKGSVLSLPGDAHVQKSCCELQVKSCTKTVSHSWDDNTPTEFCGRSQNSSSLRLGKWFSLVKHKPSHPRRETLIKMVLKCCCWGYIISAVLWLTQDFSFPLEKNEKTLCQWVTRYFPVLYKGLTQLFVTDITFCADVLFSYSLLSLGKLLISSQHLSGSFSC